MILKFWFGLLLGTVFLLTGGASITGFGAADFSGSGTLAFLLAGVCILAVVILNMVHEEKEITEK